VTLKQHGKQKGSKSIKLRGAKTTSVKFKLKASAIAAMVRHHDALAVQITARTGSYRTTKKIG
jgi:hypothetical protein